MKYLTIEDLPHYTTISVNEAAHVCGIGRSTAYNAVESGQFFETVRIKDRIRVLAQPLYKKLMGSALQHPAIESPADEERGETNE